MILLAINNSYSKILGLSVKDEKALRDELSYTVGGSSSYFSKYGPKKASFLSKRGEFPSGLIHRVINFILERNLVYDILDQRIEISQRKRFIISENVKFYDWQVKAASEALSMGRGTISAVTGSGKSLCIALLISKLNVRTLIIVPTLSIKQQLTEVLSSLFKDTSNITVFNIDSSELKNAINYDCLIIDEIHHAAAKTYRQLNKIAWTNIRYRFGFTATPFRNDSEEQLLYESIAGEVIYSLSYKRAVKHKYVVPIEAYYIDIPKQNTDAYTYQEVYNKLVVNNKIRSQLTALLFAKIWQTGASIMCLVKEVAHGRNIEDLTGAPFANGGDENSRKFLELFKTDKIKALIGTTGICGEGVDTKPCEYIIIAGSGKAKSQFMQQVGRVIRTYLGKETGKVILIRDASHKYLLRHFNVQKKILLDEYGVKPLKLDI